MFNCFFLKFLKTLHNKKNPYKMPINIEYSKTIIFVLNGEKKWKNILDYLYIGKVLFQAEFLTYEELYFQEILRYEML